MPTEPNGRSRVAVIGGGIAGLVSAWELATRGVHVEVFEREPTLGGRVRGGEIAGVSCDLGAEAFANRGGGVEALIRDLGLSEYLERPRPLGSWVIHPRISAPMPAASMLGIPVAPMSGEARRVLGLGGSLRAACEPILPQKIGRDAVTVAQFVRARLGKRVLARLVSPATRGVYSRDPAMLPIGDVPALQAARENHRSLWAATRSQRSASRSAGAAVSGLSGGMGVLVGELERQIVDHGAFLNRNTRVCSVDGGADGIRVVADGVQDRGIFDSAIVTIPGLPAADPDVDPRPSDAGASLRGVPRTESHPGGSVEIVALLLDDERLNDAPRGTGALVTREAQGGAHPIRAKALTHSSAKWQWLANNLPRNRHLIRLSYGEVADTGTARSHTYPAPPIVPMDDEAALRLVCADASQIFGFTIETDRVVGVARHRHTAPSRGIDRTQAQTDAARGQFYAGEWIDGTGLASVIPAARAIANDCHSYLSQNSHEYAQIGEHE